MDRKKYLVMPETAEAPESVLSALNNKGNVKCSHCGKPLDLNNIKIVAAGKASVKCIACGVHCKLSRKMDAREMVRATDGSLHRAKPKKKQSKKDKKRQRAIDKGWS